MNRIVNVLAPLRNSALLILATATAVSSAFAVDVAKVNGRVITDTDVKSLLGSYSEAQRHQILSDLNTRREVVSKFVDQEVLMQEAEKQKLDKDKDYEMALSAFRRQFMTDRLLAKNVRPKLSESSAKKYFEANRRKYSTDKVQAQHILLSDEKTALDVLRQAKAPGADFQSLAEKLSKDPSAKNNRGDIGIITRDAPFVETFKDAVFNAPAGSIIGPIKTQFGYHVIKIIDKKPGKSLNFEEVELRVRADLQREMVENYIIQLKKASVISFDDKGIGSIQ
ncbi:MAG: peptidylprolyl isomerase [Cryobacterium sp.]|nr:peptidylprolyl isomerase [Oligoflexia bacterium]